MLAKLERKIEYLTSHTHVRAMQTKKQNKKVSAMRNLKKINSDEMEIIVKSMRHEHDQRIVHGSQQPLLG